MNDERNAYYNVIFLQHLKSIYPKADTLNTPAPMHTFIIKASMKCESKNIGNINRNTYSHLLDQCVNSDITNGSEALMDQALNFFIMYHS